MFQRLSLLFLLTISFGGLVSSQGYRAFLSDAKLPSPRSFACTVYDGDDRIYLFGGLMSGGYDDISIYTISTDSLELLPDKFPRPNYQSKAVMDSNNGDILIFTPYTQVYKFEVATNTTTHIASLQNSGDWYDGFIQIGETSVLFITEASSSVNPGVSVVKEINLSNFDVTLHPNLPLGLNSINGVWDRADGVYIFGETSPSKDRIMLRYSLTEGTFTEVVSNFVGMRYQTSVIWDGGNVTMVSGYAGGGSNNGVTLFNPTTNSSQFVSVTDWPQYNNFQSTSAVYVEKFRRIYMFGGWAYNFFDDIWFIERPL